MKIPPPITDYFDGYFNSFCSEILEEWAGKKVMRSPEYPKYVEKVEQQHDAIKALLGENGKLLDQYEEDYSTWLCAFTVPNYLQGFRDCMLLLKKLDLL